VALWWCSCWHNRLLQVCPWCILFLSFLSLTHSLTHLLTHSLTYSLTHPLTPNSLTHPLTHSPPPPAPLPPPSSYSRQAMKEVGRAIETSRAQRLQLQKLSSHKPYSAHGF
jgi:hypothetical protein